MGFVMPVVEGIMSKESLRYSWLPGSPWNRRPNLIALPKRRRASLGHDDPYRPKSIAKPAALALHELSRASALQTLGYDLEFGVGGVSHLAGSFLDDFGPVVLSQPRCEFPFSPFSVRNPESYRQGRPPIWNAAVTDKLVVVEERAGLSATEELPALGAAFNTEQSQGANQIVQILLDACPSLN